MSIYSNLGYSTGSRNRGEKGEEEEEEEKFGLVDFEEILKAKGVHEWKCAGTHIIGHPCCEEYIEKSCKGFSNNYFSFISEIALPTGSVVDKKKFKYQFDLVLAHDKEDKPKKYFAFKFKTSKKKLIELHKKYVAPNKKHFATEKYPKPSNSEWRSAKLQDEIDKDESIFHEPVFPFSFNPAKLFSTVNAEDLVPNIKLYLQSLLSSPSLICEANCLDAIIPKIPPSLARYLKKKAMERLTTWRTLSEQRHPLWRPEGPKELTKLLENSEQMRACFVIGTSLNRNSCLKDLTPSHWAVVFESEKYLFRIELFTKGLSWMLLPNETQERRSFWFAPNITTETSTYNFTERWFVVADLPAKKDQQWLTIQEIALWAKTWYNRNPNYDKYNNNCQTFATYGIIARFNPEAATTISGSLDTFAVILPPLLFATALNSFKEVEEANRLEAANAIKSNDTKSKDKAPSFKPKPPKERPKIVQESKKRQYSCMEEYWNMFDKVDTI